VGDWETDTVIGHRQRGALLTAVERRSKYTLLRKLKRRTASAVTSALRTGLARYAGKVFTITSDNGTEFAGHETIAETLDADFFFAHAYC